MATKITSGIKVSVETEYQPQYSSPRQRHYVFTYQITIENQSRHTIQIKSRHWLIRDPTFKSREVKGEGILGQQPIIEPGQAHTYVSGCNLKSGMGKMIGTYLAERPVDGKKIEIKIPEFVMVYPCRRN